MTRIKLSSGLVLKADAAGWTLCEEKVVQSGEKAGEVRDSDLGYYSTLYTALCGVQDEEARRSGATTVEGLIHAITRLRTDLGALLQLSLTVKVGK
jgi:hypothetical protein